MEFQQRGDLHNREVEMYRVAILAIVLPLLFVGAASGQEWADNMSLGVAIGVMQPSGGDESYEDMGLTFGLRMEKPVTEKVSVMLDYRYGETESGEPPSMPSPDRFFTWGSTDHFKTNWNYVGLKTIYDFKTDASMVPYVSFGLGMTMWEVKDWTDGQGTVPKGYDADGTGGKTLSGNNLTASLGGGVEFFLNEKTSIDVGGSYGFLLQQNLDNVGFSSADYVDANNAVFEGSVALMFHFGPGDCDEDGIFGSQDNCPREPEDYDGFEDEDGCPDVDNDMDTILDVDDDCPDDAEDFNGFEDEDGCPDADSDGDGVLDIHDECPGTPAGVIVDAVGCPKPEPKPVVVPVPVPKPELVAVMVNFALDSAALDDMATGRLDALVTFLLEDTTVTVDVGGHASSEGADEYNQALSERRAVAVRDYLAEKGVDAERVTVVGYGVQQPLVPNDSETNRSQNRRAIVTPVYPE